MKHLYRIGLLFFLGLFAFTNSYGQVFITELADPNNDLGARYIELYNAGASAVDFTEGSGWRIDKYTNASATVSQTLALTGSIPAGGFYIIATGAADTDFETLYGVVPDQFDGANDNVAGSNGDDNLELYDGTGTLIDQFGVPGEDGTGTNHEFEDGRAERKETVTEGNATWDVNEWNIDSDQPSGDGAIDAPGGFDPGSWIGESAPTNTIVQFESSSATVSEGDGTYALTLTITNEDAVATGVDVIISTDVTPTADATDIDNYTTQSVTFPSSDASNQSVTITLTDDVTYEGAEVIYFELTNISGGNSAELGSNVIFELNITDNDPLPTETLPYAETFDSDLNGVLVFSVASNIDWEFDGGVASANGFGSDVANDDWLITPAIDLTSAVVPALSFTSWTRFADSFYPGITVSVSTDYSGTGDPSGSTWTPLSPTLSPEDSQETTESGKLDLSSYNGQTIYIAFRYTTSGTGGGSTSWWQIDDIAIAENPVLAEPTNHVTSFVATANGFGNIDLTWSDNDGAQAAEGFLIKASSVSLGDITDPVDGTPEADGAMVANVSSGEGSYSFGGLESETEYFFQIYPYTNSGDDIDFKTDGTIPSDNATTNTTPVLVINEILADPPSGADVNGDGNASTSEDEFVEIVNNGSSAVDLEGISLSDGASVRHVFPASTVLDPGKAIVVFGAGTPTGDFGGSIVQASSTNSLGMNNGGDDVILSYGSTVIASITYPGASDQSLNLDVDVVGSSYVAHSTIAPGGALYSPGTQIDGSIFCVAPTSQASNLNFSDVMETEIGLSWSRGNGDAVLIVAKEGEMVSLNPISGTSTYTASATFGSGTDLGDGTYVIFDGSGTDVTVSGLTQGTEYHFAVYEYSSADNCFLTSALTGSQSTVTPNDTNTDIIALSSPIGTVTLSSLSDTEGEAVAVHGFTIVDEGTDGLSTFVETMQINSNEGNSATWTESFGGAYLSDGVDTYPMTIDELDLLTLDLSSSPYEVENGTSQDFTLYIWLNTAVTDQETVNFEVVSDNQFTASPAGSQFRETLNSGGVSSAQHTIDVVATTFDVNANSIVPIAENFSLSTSAVDENGNVDVAPRTISLSKTSGTGNLTGTGLSAQAMTDGVYEWTDLQLDAADDYVLTVDDDGSALTETVDIEAGEITGTMFISEYIEGSGNNKAIEIYNGTGTTVDLSEYSVDLYDDDGETTVNNTLALSDIAPTLAAGEVIVIANSGADASILAEADITSSVTFYGGDNPIALVRNGEIIDLFGEIGVDPAGSGWNVAGVAEATTEQTLVRKGSVTAGNPVALASFGTSTEDSEWIVYSQNDFNYIGFHTVEGELFPLITLDQAGFDGSFGFVTFGNQSEVSSYSVTTADLTGDLTITPPAGFELSATAAFDGMIYTNSSPWVISPVDGEISQEVFVRFNPTVADGAVYSGEINHESTGADSKTVSVSGQEGALAADLFFSEYTESAGGNNKLFEIYNNLGAAADLTQYSVGLYFNGSLTAGNTLALSDIAPTLEDGGVLVIANSGADQALLDISDITSNVTFYNGDDALALLKNGIVIDVIGEIGSRPDPAWDVAGVAGATADHTLIRKPTVSQGNPVNLASFGTNAEDSEWIVLDYSDNSDLGSHSTEQEGDPIITVTPAEFVPNFGVIQVGGTVTQNYSVSAVDMLGDVTITAPSGFLVSTDGSTFLSAVTLSPVDGTVDPSTITVQFAPDAEGEFAGSISHESTDALTKTLSVSGTAVGEEVIFFENFSSCDALNSMISESISGDEMWECTPNGETGAGVRMSGFNGSAQDNLDWLITPGIDLSGVDAANLSFDTDVRYDGPDLEVYISTDYSDDADAATWTPLTATFDEDADNFDTWTSSGEIDLSDYAGSTVYVGFLYSSSAANGAATWSIDNVLVTETQPFFTASVSTLGDFNQVDVGEVSVNKSFTVEGFGLTEDVEVTPPAQFEVSTTSNFASKGTNSSPLVISVSDGSVDQQVFVRFAPSTEGTFNGNVVVSTSGFDNITLNVSGVGVDDEEPALGLEDVEVVIYPNPIVDAFEISNVKNAEISVEIFALNGSEMPFTKRGELYDISSLNSGIYVIVIKDGVSERRQQIIKE